MSSCTILLFGDQLASKLPALRKLYVLSSPRPSLKAFLEASTDILQCQLDDILPSERDAYGDFCDILQLVRHYESSTHLNEGVGTVLTTIIQVAELLLLVESQPSILDSGNHTHQVGICIGLVAAAVAATANHATDVITLGLECVAISFRLGIELWRRTMLIEESPESWGCTIIGMHPDEIQNRLWEFNQSRLSFRQAYIGVQAETWSTIFAPPSTIRSLVESIEFSQAPQSRLPSAIAVHAGHLPPLPVDKIVGEAPALHARTRVGRVQSSSTCQPFSASNLGDLLYQIVEDIAQKPLYLEAMIKNLTSSLQAEDVREINLMPIGPTHSVSIVQRELQRGVAIVNVVRPSNMDARRESTRSGSGHVAIVGMSGRFPDSDSISELWDVLQSGRSTHSRIPKSRFTIDDFYDPSLETPIAVATEIGCFLRNPGEFDNLLFNISPREAFQMDPVQRLLLMTTYEALQMAGYSRNATISTLQAHIATFLGQSAEEWKAINDQEGVDTHYIPGTMRSFAPGRLNHYFHWGGGITSVDTACSASATAIHLACKALLAREVDTAIAGGGHVCVAPALYSGLSKGGFLSTGPCQTFADSADGYCRGEAVGVVVLKRLEDALREGDDVLAVIRRTERNSNAGTGSITFPSSDAQAALYRKVLHNSGTEANDISFVEMHGTGTQAGDAAEMSALLQTFGRSRPRSFPLYVGALKAAIGHAEGAAGVSSLIKAVLMLRKRAMPPQPGWPFKLNQKFGSLDEANVRISDGVSSLEASETGIGRCKIIVNSFDAAGGNVSMLIEEAPEIKSPAKECGRSAHVVVVSGRTPKALAANEVRLKEFLSSCQDVDMASIAYTTTARRYHEVHRVAYVVSSVQELLAKLGRTEGKSSTPNRSVEPQLVFTFTGQGSIYTSMGAALYKTSSRFKSILDSFQSLCNIHGLARFLDIITGSQDISNASASQTQLSLAALEVALVHYFKSLGVRPAVAIGHSLGEYAALCTAGVISVADMLFLVHTRAALIEKHCTAHAYSMLAVSVSVDSTEALLLQYQSHYPSCQIACINAPVMTVVSGKMEELQALQTTLKNDSIQSTLLKVPYGFHSSQMEPILDNFEEAAKKVHFLEPVIPVVSTLHSEVVRLNGVFNASYLRRQMREPVNFLGAVQACEEEGLIKSDTLVLEVGPHPVCNFLLTKACMGMKLSTFASLRQGEDSWKTISSLLAAAYIAGAPVNWSEFHKECQSSVQLLQLPTYVFDYKSFWIPYKTKVNRKPLDRTEDSTIGPSIGTQLPYTCVQKLHSFVVYEGGSVAATFCSKTAQPDLRKAIQGHVVNGVSLCPASVFVEMAHTAASYIVQSTGTMGESFHLEVNDLHMVHALVVPDKGIEQVIQVESIMDPLIEVVSVTFTSTTSGSPPSTHGTCKVRYSKAANNIRQWAYLDKLIRNRVKTLIESSQKGPTHRMSKSLFYQLFGNLVEYHEPYQSIQEAYISPDFHDAVAVCSLGDDAAHGLFTSNPYTMDGIVHLSGFILNANLSKERDVIHISNRIGSFQVLQNLSADTQYMCYAAIREQTTKGVTVCDVYVFDEESLVAVCTDITFQRMTRDVFSMMIGQPDSSSQSPLLEQSISQSQPRRGLQNFPSSTPKTDLADVLLRAISVRTGIGLEEFEPSLCFSDIGVDSQLSIAIMSDVRKQSGTDLPAAFFNSYPTVAEAKRQLGAIANAPSSQGSPPPYKRATPPIASTESSHSHGLSVITKPSEVFLSIVAAEIGMTERELADMDDFESAGIDSMMSIKLVSLFKQKTGTELPASFFQNHQTIADVKAELDGEIPIVNESVPAPLSVAICTPPPELESNAVLIQGKTTSTQRPVFMIADGHGSADAFVHLPPLPNGQRLYALESPFVDDPEAFTLTIPQLAHIYIKTIRRLQPRGSYIIGGRSAGAAYAYEVAYQLAQQNEVISGLLLIDMRVPRALPHARYIDREFVTRAWAVIVSHTKVLLDPGDLAHAAATIRALHSYDPLPFPKGQCPNHKYVFWATFGVNDNPDQTLSDKTVIRSAAMGPPLLGQDLESVGLEEFEAEFKSWFWGHRETFGANGWDTLLGEGVQVRKVAGDHFCMMAPPYVSTLGTALNGAVLEIESVEQ